jgi:hypothetical protein
MERCTKCGNMSLIKKPHGRIMTEKFGTLIHTADEYSMDCLHQGCGYTSGIIRINTKNENKSIWKRIFNLK